MPDLPDLPEDVQAVIVKLRAGASMMPEEADLVSDFAEATWYEMQELDRRIEGARVVLASYRSALISDEGMTEQLQALYDSVVRGGPSSPNADGETGEGGPPGTMERIATALEAMVHEMRSKG